MLVYYHICSLDLSNNFDSEFMTNNKQRYKNKKTFKDVYVYNINIRLNILSYQNMFNTSPDPLKSWIQTCKRSLHSSAKKPTFYHIEHCQTLDIWLPVTKQSHLVCQTRSFFSWGTDSLHLKYDPLGFFDSRKEILECWPENGRKIGSSLSFLASQYCRKWIFMMRSSKNDLIYLHVCGPWKLRITTTCKGGKKPVFMGRLS